MVTKVTEGLKGVIYHLDDVLVWGQTQEEHDAHLHVVLEKIQKAGVTLNVNNCNLFKQEMTFLGHVISASSLCADLGKTEAVRKMEEMTNVRELGSFFIGMLN